MKRMAAIMATAILMAQMGASAFENPDKVPSIGIDYTDTNSSITSGILELYDSSDNTTSFHRETGELDIRQTTIDVRFAVAKYVSMDLHGGPSSVSAFDTSHSGYNLGASLRVYMPGL